MRARITVQVLVLVYIRGARCSRGKPVIAAELATVESMLQQLTPYTYVTCYNSCFRFCFRLCLLFYAPIWSALYSKKKKC